VIYVAFNGKMKSLEKIEIIPINVSDNIVAGQNITELILKSIRKKKESLKNNDILVVTHKIISKAEGRIIDLSGINPSPHAIRIARLHNKDPRIVHLIMLEANEIVRLKNGVIVAETKHGFVCANAGIDSSNIGQNENIVALLPENPDYSARKLRREIKALKRKNVGVIITDTFGRPFREGQVNVAIGVSGLNPVKSYIGQRDAYGKYLRVTEIAIADEIAAAAELVMKKSSRIPAAIVRGLHCRSDKSNILTLLRPKKNDIFR
jgi:coenzyme F420-0:L-glutamate ligase/coenzyme F420-1:gamma-L-glutamate ligase